MKLRLTVAYLAIVLMPGLAGLALAQVTTATLYGIVQDQSGSVIAGAQVTLTHDATGAVKYFTAEDPTLTRSVWSGVLNLIIAPCGVLTGVVSYD
jgi:hypothetical protein